MEEHAIVLTILGLLAVRLQLDFVFSFSITSSSVSHFCCE